jgi:hypothetical protein
MDGGQICKRGPDSRKILKMVFLSQEELRSMRV